MYISKNLHQVLEGVWEQNEKVFSQDFYGKTYPAEMFINQLDSDVPHYSKMLETIKKEMPEIIGKYKNICSIGGGFPKFESVILQPEKIAVFDLIADFYKDLMPDFKSRYKKLVELPKISFKTIDLKPFEIKGNYDCITFVHFLEHCENWDTVTDWLFTQTKDIIIYMPCIEAATSEDWVHYYHGQKVDHNVFFTIKTLEDFANANDYTCKSLRYSDDMLIWMQK